MLKTLTIAAIILIATTSLPAQPASEFDAGSMLDPQQIQRIETAVDQALEYLVINQNLDGSWPSGVGNNNGINGICLLALLGRGHTPTRGPYQVPILRAVNFIYSTQDPKTGLYVSPDPTHGPMYEHALATLAMVEAYGYLPEPRLHQSIQRALDLIVKAQNPEGGWRYHPIPQDADISATVMQVVALHAAINARFKVPDETMQKALAYVKACALPGGGFAYKIGHRTPLEARTAAGILCMQLLGAFDEPEVIESLDWLDERKYSTTITHFWYFNYYAMQAYFQAGGERWLRFSTRVREFLLAEQDSDGSWQGFHSRKYNGDKRCYSTAFATMTLQVYLHYLPAYQR